MSQQLYVKNEDGTFVPAAGVQGDTPWRVGEFWSSSNPQNKVLCLAVKGDIEAWEKRKDFIRWMSPATVQPDSGRDAALEEAAKAAETQYCDLSGPPDDPHPEAQAYNSAVYDCARAIRALAAHPAPSSDAGPVADLIVHMNSVEAKIRPEYSTFDALKVGEYPVYLAAHPANGAQAGLSQLKIFEIARQCGIGDWKGTTVEEFASAILAAAKKGGA